MVTFADHVQHFDVYYRETPQLDRYVLSKAKGFSRWQWSMRDCILWIFHIFGPHSGINAQPGRALAL